MTMKSIAKEITAEELDHRFDAGEDVLDYFDLDNPIVQHAPARDDSQRQINISLPAWLVDILDDEAHRRAISRKAVINDWLVDRADQEMARRTTLASA